MMRTLAPFAVVAALLPACPDLVATSDSAGGSGAARTSGTATATPTTTQPDLTTTGFELVCYPGTVRCDPDTPGVLETCKDTGLEWEQTVCAANADCVDDVEHA